MKYSNKFIKKSISLVNHCNSNLFLSSLQQKQWSKKYFALFRKSHSGIQRLEVFGSEKSYLKGGKLQKIIPLRHCFRIVQMSSEDQANVFEVSCA